MAARRRVTTKKRTRTRAAGSGDAAKQTLERTVRALERRLASATAALARLREQHEKKLAAVQRATDRRLAAMVRELAALRHHEARAATLERLLAERNAAAVVERRDDGQTSGTAG
jgi:hypothetical protein